MKYCSCTRRKSMFFCIIVSRGSSPAALVFCRFSSAIILGTWLKLLLISLWVSMYKCVCAWIIILLQVKEPTVFAKSGTPFSLLLRALGLPYSTFPLWYTHMFFNVFYWYVKIIDISSNYHIVKDLPQLFCCTYVFSFCSMELKF